MRSVRGGGGRSRVVQGVRGLHRGRRQGGGGGSGTGARSSRLSVPGRRPVAMNDAMGVGNRSDIKRMLKVGNGGTVIVFKVVGAGMGLSGLRHDAPVRPARGAVMGDAFIDDRARSQMCRGGLGFGRSVSMHNVHNSRTVRTMACFVSSTVLLKVSHMHVLRKANANVLHALVHDCLKDIPKMTRCRSRRMRFNKTNVAMMSLGWCFGEVENYFWLVFSVFTLGLRGVGDGNNDKGFSCGCGCWTW